jgi:hypothetical protein
LQPAIELNEIRKRMKSRCDEIACGGEIPLGLRGLQPAL